MQRLSLMLPILALTFIAPACDDPANEAELQALNMENGPEDLTQFEEEIIDDNNVEPSIEEFDLAADETAAAGPPGKCCKAKCSWDPYTWRQLPPPYDKNDGCNINANWWCQYGGYGPGPGMSHSEDAEWRTCGS